MTDTRTEKLLLIALAALALLILGILGVMALWSRTMDPNAAGMIGVIVTGLIAFSKDIIQAIRGYSMSAQLGKVTDQLAASAPAIEAAPADAVAGAQAAADSAQNAADEIAAQGKPA